MTTTKEEDEETWKEEWCIHGQWVDGACLCDPGKATFFNDKLLTQKYCDLDESKVASLSVAYPPKHFLYLSTMSFTVVLTVAAFVVLASAVAVIIQKAVTSKKSRKARQELIEFRNSRVIRYGGTTVVFWAPPDNFQCINQQQGGGGLEAKVVVAYNPQNEGELTLKLGMTVTNVEELQRGWCKGSAGGKTGFFPAAMVEILT